MLVPVGVVSKTDVDTTGSCGEPIAAGLSAAAVEPTPVGGAAVGVAGSRAAPATSVGDTVAAIPFDGACVDGDDVVAVLCWHWTLVAMPSSAPSDIAVLRRGDDRLGAAPGEAGDAAPPDAPIAADLAGFVAELAGEDDAELEVDEAAPAEGPPSPEPGSAVATPPQSRIAAPRPAAAAATRN